MDVARASGCSNAAVSFVLNDAPLASRISAETKQRIKEAAAKLGYRPNLLAKQLRSQRTHTIGIVVFDISDPYCAQILQGIEEVLYGSRSFLPILADVQNDRTRLKRYVTLLLQRQVEGVIVLGNSVYPEAELLESLRECRTPIVMIGRELENGSISSVTVDNALGAHAALEHLYDLGHRRIAFIRGPKAMIDSGQRWKAIESFAGAVGMQLEASLIVDSPLRQAGQHAGYDLTTRLLRSAKKFTALHAYDDLTAFGAIRALSEAGMEVPRQCSVIGFDDVAMSAYYNPPLTTIHQDMELQGRVGAELLLGVLREPGPESRLSPRRERVTPRLVVRASTVPPA